MKIIESTAPHNASSVIKILKHLSPLAKQALKIEVIQAKATHYESLFRLN